MRNKNIVTLNFQNKDKILKSGMCSKQDIKDTYYKFNKKLNIYQKKVCKKQQIFYDKEIHKKQITNLLEPKALINWKRYTVNGEEQVKEIKRDADGTIRENLIIKGNNLLALHSLKKQFAGKVKLIYIDPPFNTGNDSFQYNDNFNHSTWLTFMRNRLEVAKTCLKNDGLLFINIDDIEEAYLKVLCDEIFGRDNFINVIAVKSSTPSGTKTAHKYKTIIKQKDLILVYKKGGSVNLTPQYTKREKWDTHYSLYLEKVNGKFKLSKLIDKLKEKNIIDSDKKLKDIDIDNKSFKKFYLSNADNICRLLSHKNKEADKISRTKKDLVYERFSEGVSRRLYYNGQVIIPLSQGIKKVYTNQKFTQDLGMLLCDFWSDIDFQNTQNEGGVSFPTAKKPETLLSRIIDLATEEGDIVLDYHLGSGTTCAVAHKMGRQYIGIEQLDYGKNDSVIRLQNVINGDKSGISKSVKWQGGGEFIYFELAKWNEKAKEEIDNCQNLEELEAFFDEMYERYFLDYNLKINEFKEKVLKDEKFRDLDLAEQKQMFKTMLDNNQMYVNKTEMTDSKYGIDKEYQNLTNLFYD